ncbi:SEL1-like repeat protein [Sphingomonas sp.]|jgi:hypothetical protein|uniref:tetratricopeptide repeat protein n=1 Tax=Sphingomonas sp. TaxID=28214 RepID=UPI002EDAF398
MARAEGIRRALTIALGGTAFAAASQAQAQTAPPQDQVTVTGNRMPSAEAPRSATCEALVRDPYFRGLLEVSGQAGVLGPPIYLPTRMPRNPDYSAPPRSPIGSPLPSLPKARFGVRDAVTSGESGVVSNVYAADLTSANGSGISLEPGSVESGVAACRAVYERGGGPAGEAGRPTAASSRLEQGPLSLTESASSRFANGLATRAAHDKSLPTAFALFDQGRYGESLEWFRKASDKLPAGYGGAEADLFIGKLYLQGLGDKSDIAQGIKWLKKTATASFNPISETPVFDPQRPEMNTAPGEAAIILANLYRYGSRDVPKNLAESRKWYERARDVGHIPAAKVLGDLYYDGSGGPRDVKKAVSYYREAAKYGLPSAQVALADILHNGEDTVAQDRKQSLAWYQAAAKSNHPGALYALARAYDLGEGAKPDPQLAIGFYKSAALGGNAAAMAAMGTYFYEGKLVARNYATARRWFEAAAGQSDPDGMFNLAAMLSKGEGGPKDLPKAWAWMKRAGATGHQNAPRGLATLESRMTPDERQAAAASIRS